MPVQTHDSPLDAARIRLGLTYAETGRRLGVSAVTVFRWCKAQRRPPAELLVLLGLKDLSTRQTEWAQQRGPHVTVSLPPGIDHEEALARTAQAVGDALRERAGCRQ